ncbi:SGNH/GDSL hydrolase family protein [Roseivirga sp. E12]|uniref:SGNH/GDSL hydrolase family protein n=1 Tax=Roseivirga sp. E12 TaxID=2819237 RepID=UPI001ABC8CB8|nr:SGNH/GDSL hydrolase family protein [Roseivirga sp. E12]MBO3699322.1 SGNH/GDSL hydrolase family protein [Roseivirga sp. E12]
MKKILRKYLLNLSLIFIGIVFGLLLAELTLRIVAPHDLYYVREPNTNAQIDVHLHDLFPGLDSTIQHSTNSDGYRSRHLFEKSRYNILALGGSTTECIGLSDKDNWTYLLEELINTADDLPPVTIGNVGRSGLNLAHHSVQVEKLSQQMENIDMVIMLVGINDFMRAIHLNENYLPYDPDPMLLRRSFIRFPRKEASAWYQKTELWMHLRVIKRNYLHQKNSEDDDVRAKILETRKKQKEAVLSEHLPNLELALKDYSDKIDEIIKISQKQSIELVLITQPVLWKEAMSPQEIDYTSLSELIIQNAGYVPGALKDGMEQFNEVLRQKGQEDRVHMIDLEAVLPSDTTVFFDHCHFNKTGTIQVAKIMHQGLSMILKNQLN